jgi:tRNA-splicing ligase RtcB
MSWKSAARRDPGGFYRLPADGGEVRIFMTEALFAEAEESLGDQIKNAWRFPGVVDVAITPDAHHGYGVPVGCVIATTGTLAMGPVGYDIGCGMAALNSDVPRERATPDRVKEFSRRVMARVGLGMGAKGQPVSKERFRGDRARRGGGPGAARGGAERDRIPVEDGWDIPRTRGPGAGRPSSAAWAAATISSSCSTTASGSGSCTTRARAASATAWPRTTSSRRARSWA